MRGTGVWDIILLPTLPSSLLIFSVTARPFLCLIKRQQKGVFTLHCLIYRGTMSATSDEIKSLLALRDSLNSSIDAYVSLTAEEKSQRPKVNQARQKVWSTATKLAREVDNPQQEATALAFAVSTVKVVILTHLC